MFTGIVKALVEVKTLEKKPGLFTFGIDFPPEFIEALEGGASVAVDGVCLTATKIEGSRACFDAMTQTLSITTLGSLEVGDKVNVERSARFGDEIGGHILSGHVYGKAKITHIERPENNQFDTFEVPSEWMKYILPKGYIALDGVSLTIVDRDPSGKFRVAFIPETLERTTFGFKNVGREVNVEIDSQTQAIVDTVERILVERKEIS